MSIAKEVIHILPRQEPVPLGMAAAGWLAVHDPSLSAMDVSKVLIADVLTRYQDKALVGAWQRLGALQTIRAFSRQRSALVEHATTESTALMTLNKGEVWWKDLRLGTLVTLFQHIMPQEAQARLSYDTFRYRFLSWLEPRTGVLALETEISDATVTLFIPDGIASPDTATEWRHFVTYAFSAKELQQTFVLLLNSIALSNKGFSVPDIPIVSRDQADVLTALFYATLQNIALRLKRYEQELYTTQQGGNEQQATSPKSQKLREQLETQHNRYDQALADMNETFEQLRDRDAERAQRIQMLARAYTSTATRQLNVTKAIIEKAVTRTKELLMVPSDDFFLIPPLLTYWRLD